jgi:hypothetical protein
LISGGVTRRAAKQQEYQVRFEDMKTFSQKKNMSEGVL